jgi:hypothetical protein
MEIVMKEHSSGKILSIMCGAFLLSFAAAYVCVDSGELGYPHKFTQIEALDY